MALLQILQYMKKPRENQAQNVDASGGIRTGKAAGIALYALSSTTRGTAKEARRARNLIKKAWEDGDIGGDFDDYEDVPVDVNNLLDAGIKADEAEKLVRDYTANEAAASQMYNSRVMAGFGNNGGEEISEPPDDY